MSTVLHRASGFIEGIPLLGWGKSGECTFAGALSAATQATRHRVSYQTVLGVTGLAYRVRWYRGIESKWCPSSACGEFPVEIEAARKALGWSLVSEIDFHAKLAESIPQIMASIDHGLPVLAYDSAMNMAVIVGYEGEGKKVVMHDYFHPDGPVTANPNDLVRFVMFLGERHRHLSASDAALEGMRIGLKQWRSQHDPVEDRTRGYWMGRAAYEKWAEDLVTKEERPEQDAKDLFFVNWWNFDVIRDCHANAPRYLREVKPFFPKAISQRLETGALLFEDACKVYEGCLINHDAFFGPWSGKSIDDWTPEVRRREADVLKTARDRVEEAIMVIEDLLQSTELSH